MNGVGKPLSRVTLGGTYSTALQCGSDPWDSRQARSPDLPALCCGRPVLPHGCVCSLGAPALERPIDSRSARRDHRLIISASPAKPASRRLRRGAALARVGLSQRASRSRAQHGITILEALGRAHPPLLAAADSGSETNAIDAVSAYESVIGGRHTARSQHHVCLGAEPLHCLTCEFSLTP